MFKDSCSLITDEEVIYLYRELVGINHAAYIVNKVYIDDSMQFVKNLDNIYFTMINKMSDYPGSSELITYLREPDIFIGICSINLILSKFELSQNQENIDVISFYRRELNELVSGILKELTCKDLLQWYSLHDSMKEYLVTHKTTMYYEIISDIFNKGTLKTLENIMFKTDSDNDTIFSEDLEVEDLEVKDLEVKDLEVKDLEVEDQMIENEYEFTRLDNISCLSDSEDDGLVHVIIF